MPFYKEFVEKYLVWMDDEDIKLETGSDDMKLEDVIDVQQMYNKSKNDYCFIIYFNEKNSLDVSKILDDQIDRKDLIPYLVGDVNLFSPDKEMFEINVSFELT